MQPALGWRAADSELEHYGVMAGRKDLAGSHSHQKASMVFDVYAKISPPSQQHQRTAKPSHLHAHPQQFQPRVSPQVPGSRKAHLHSHQPWGLLALISVPQPGWRYAERKVLFQGFSSCCRRLASAHAIREHREFLPLESVQG